MGLPAVPPGSDSPPLCGSCWRERQQLMGTSSSAGSNSSRKTSTVSPSSSAVPLPSGFLQGDSTWLRRRDSPSSGSSSHVHHVLLWPCAHSLSVAPGEVEAARASSLNGAALLPGGGRGKPLGGGLRTPCFKLVTAMLRLGSLGCRGLWANSLARTVVVAATLMCLTMGAMVADVWLLPRAPWWLRAYTKDAGLEIGDFWRPELGWNLPLPAHLRHMTHLTTAGADPSLDDELSYYHHPNPANPDDPDNPDDSDNPDSPNPESTGHETGAKLRDLLAPGRPLQSEGERKWPAIDEPYAFRKFDPRERYLYWPRNPYDTIAGLEHRSHSLACALGEAVYLNRTLVFDLRFKIPAAHNFGRNKVHDIRLYFDLDAVERDVRLVEMSYFWIEWAKFHESSHSRMQLTSKVVGATASASEMLDDPTMLIERRKPKKYRYSLCFRQPLSGSWEDMEEREYPAQELQCASPLLSVMNTISQRLGDYDAVHVRRGDRMTSPAHPTLDRDTRPEQLQKHAQSGSASFDGWSVLSVPSSGSKKTGTWVGTSIMKLLPRWIQPGRTLYIATDEMKKGFFDPLKHLYNVSMLRDHRDLWAKGSAWWNAVSSYFRMPSKVNFDGMMQAAVDYNVMKNARTFVDTWGYLTAGGRAGANEEQVAEWLRFIGEAPALAPGPAAAPAPASPLVPAAAAAAANVAASASAPDHAPMGTGMLVPAPVPVLAPA